MASIIDEMAIPTSHLEGVGRVAASWALFEMMIDVSLWHLIGLEDHQKAACLTGQITGSARKIDAAISLIKLRPHEEKRVKELNSIAKASQSLAERRNRVIHDPAMAEEGKIFRLEATARKVLKLEQVQIFAHDITSLLADIDANTRRYVTTMSEFYPIPPPWLETPAAT